MVSPSFEHAAPANGFGEDAKVGAARALTRINVERVAIFLMVDIKGIITERSSHL